MSGERRIIVERDGQIVWITIDRPAVMNALDPPARLPPPSTRSRPIATCASR